MTISCHIRTRLVTKAQHASDNSSISFCLRWLYWSSEQNLYRKQDGMPGVGLEFGRGGIQHQLGIGPSGNRLGGNVALAAERALLPGAPRVGHQRAPHHLRRLGRGMLAYHLIGHALDAAALVGRGEEVVEHRRSRRQCRTRHGKAHAAQQAQGYAVL